MGLNWVEVDVKISKDLIPILLHDDSLDRTTNGKGLPINFEYDSLKNLDAGYFFYNQNTKIYIPTLQDILILSQKNNICLNIELKPNIGYEKENVKAIIKVIKKLDFNKEYYFSSFDLNSLIIMKEYFPDSKCGLLVETFNNNLSLIDILSLSKRYDFFSCGFNKNIINTEIMEKIRDNRLAVTAFSDENIKINEANELWSIGVKSIFVDDPSDFKI